MAKQPTWEELHRLGEELSKELEPRMSFKKIGDALGVNKQKAWHEGMVALGKLGYQLKALYTRDGVLE